MQLAINSFIKLPESKIVILGDMFELGKYSKFEHQEIINLLEKLKIRALLVGEEFYKLKIQSDSCFFFKTKIELVLEISKNLIKEKNILIKGSRGMKMEELINHI
jgi:UDP-N-acetylmuramoyl-tripeptide--D-alanyl-D-alanine ligase